MGFVISKAVKIKINEIFFVMKFLKEKGVMEDGLRIKKEGEYAYIPVKSYVEGFEMVEGEFEEIQRKRSYMDFLHIPEEMKKYLPRSMDIVGNIAIVKLDENIIPYSKEIAEAIMKFKPSIKTVAMDKGVKGEYRVRDLEVIGGNGLETIHNENGVKIYVNLSRVYFSPRLSTERARILSQVKDDEIILDLFCGAGPFSILIGKKRKVKIYAVDKNPEAIECLKKSLVINKINNVIPINGDVKEIMNYLPEGKRAILDLPMESLKYLQYVKKKAEIFHIYYKCDSPENVKKELEGMGLKVKNHGLVHGYSPKEGMYFFDAIRGE